MKNVKEKMNAHKEFVAKSMERRQKQGERVGAVRLAEQKRWEELKEKQQIEAEERVKKLALLDAERV